MGINISDIQKGKDSKEAGSSIMEFLNKDISFSKGLPDKKKLDFFSELSILISSGVDLRSSLEIIVQEQTKDKEKELYSSICKKVIDGESFSSALKNSGKFSLYEYFTVQIGEESGNLSSVLQELSTYFEKKMALRKKVINAVSYPALVLTMAIVALIFMMNYLVPMFVDVFMRFDAELPKLTQTIISISNFFNTYSFAILLAVIGLGITFYSLWKSPAFQRIFSIILLKTPLVNDYVRIIFLQRFFQSMAMLTAAHTPMVTSLGMVRKMIKLSIAQKELQEIEESIVAGKLLHESMQGSLLFSKRIQALVKVGEEVNQLGNIFSNLNEQLRQQLDHKVGMLSNVLEPLLIIFVGALVAVILVAMYLPMFQISTAIQ